MNIGILGGGAIAQFLLQEINEKKLENMKITSVYVRDKDKYKKMFSVYEISLFDHLDDFLNSSIDIVVEAANVEAVQALIPTILKKKDAVLISIGALSDESFLNELYAQAESCDRSIYLPSGAVGGLDLLQNAHALGTVSQVTLTTRKPASSFIQEPIDQEMVVFKGTAKDAIKKYPKNINVSIILSLAGIGVNETKVEIIADPFVENNIHTVVVKGEFGSATLSVTNNPMKANPNTSYLAALSIVGTLKRVTSRIKIGS